MSRYTVEQLYNHTFCSQVTVLSSAHLHVKYPLSSLVPLISGLPHDGHKAIEEVVEAEPEGIIPCLPCLTVEGK